MSQAKQSYYFKHDSNARNDHRIIAVRMKHGLLGYGIFFVLIELLRECRGYKMPFNLENLHFEVRESKEIIEDIIKNYDLFKIKGEFFYSESLINRMKTLDNERKRKAIGGKKGAKLRYERPTRQQIREYAQEIKSNANIEEFYDYNEKKGWIKKDWKDSLKKWEKNTQEWNKSTENGFRKP